MKIAIIVLGILAATTLLGVFILSRMVLVTSTSGSGQAGKVETVILESNTDTGLRIQLTLTGADKEHAITHISLARGLAGELGASAPDGFTVEPMKPEGREANDSDTMKFIEEWNQENVQLAGDHRLIPNQSQIFVIPAKVPNVDDGYIQFTYGRRGRFGGVIGHFGVGLGEG